MASRFRSRGRQRDPGRQSVARAEHRESRPVRRSLAQQHGAFDRVPQLAHVARTLLIGAGSVSTSIRAASLAPSRIETLGAVVGPSRLEPVVRLTLAAIRRSSRNIGGARGGDAPGDLGTRRAALVDGVEESDEHQDDNRQSEHELPERRLRQGLHPR